jgi:TIR domain/Pentapeptide repeats (8 copies)
VNLTAADLTRADLSEADLTQADLSRADLTRAVLSGARLNGADLAGARLIDTKLDETDLTRALLYRANLTGAVLSGAHLIRANLNEADLTHAQLAQTIFAASQLTNVQGLDRCAHSGPSMIDFVTLKLSDPLPVVFLRGVGLQDNLINYLPSLLNETIQHYSCFISYSSKDEDFAERLHTDLQNKGVRCWFAPHDMPIGAKIIDALDEAIRLQDKVLLILSEGAIASDWVEREVNGALEEERTRQQAILFPVRIDDAVMQTSEAWARLLRRERHIGDFTGWKEPDSYHRSFERLMRDLRAEAAITEMELVTSKAEAVAKNAKTEKVKELLGRALVSGDRAIAGLTDDASQAEGAFQKWVRPVRDLIVAAYGPGEGHLFLDDSGFTFWGGGTPKSRVGNKVRGRLKRITELMQRVDRLTPGKDFDPAKFSPDQFD